jgi:hypothetical protein
LTDSPEAAARQVRGVGPFRLYASKLSKEEEVG